MTFFRVKWNLFKFNKSIFSIAKHAEIANKKKPHTPRENRARWIPIPRNVLSVSNSIVVYVVVLKSQLAPSQKFRGVPHSIARRVFTQRFFRAYQVRWQMTKATFIILDVAHQRSREHPSPPTIFLLFPQICLTYFSLQSMLENKKKKFATPSRRWRGTKRMSWLVLFGGVVLAFDKWLLILLYNLLRRGTLSEKRSV